MRFILSVLLLCVPFISYCEDLLSQPAWVYKGKGDVYYKEGEIPKAIVQYKKAILKKKEQIKDATKNGYPEANLSLAKIYRDEGLFDLALSYLKIAENYKNLFQIPDQLYNLLYTKADIYLKMNKLGKAIDVYEEIIRIDKNIPRENPLKSSDNKKLKKKFGKAYFILGEIKYNNNNFENAIPYLEKARYYRYNFDKTVRYLINCYKEIGNFANLERLKSLIK